MSRIYNLFYRYDPGHIELKTAFTLFLWGAWLLLFPNAFETSPSYDTLEALPQWVWASLAITGGVAQVSASLAGPRWLRRTCAALGAMYWFLVVASVASVNVASTAVPTYSIIALYSMWAHFRLGHGEPGLWRSRRNRE
jgi:hypothetical protein